MRIVRCLLLFIYVIILPVGAQVANNQINQRYHLSINEDPVLSTTSNSSVEWKCVNKALTNKCLVYHNDQWFTFTVDQDGAYYINLSGQVCKKRLGTQLILIEGNPCEIKSYRIRRCVPQLPKEDSFVKVDSLKAGITYLINVDGFLADECDFSIQVSSRPSGFPLPIASSDTLEVNTEVKKEVARLTWFIEEQRAPMLTGFTVLRMSAHDVKGKIVNQQSIRRNTYGAYETRYLLTDTLPRPGLYTYKIFGEQIASAELVLLTTEYARYDVRAEASINKVQKEVMLPLNYEQGVPFDVFIIDSKTSEQLYKKQNRFDATQGKLFRIDLGEFIDKGRKDFTIIISDFSAKGIQEFYYRLNDKGQLVKQ